MNFATKLLALILMGSFGILTHATFVPENEIRVPISTSLAPFNVSESEFRQVVSRVQQAYSSVVSAHGGRLSISGDWNNNTPNAAATQMFGNWQVKITGGLARRPELTADGLTLIVCHELGHHLAGFAFAPSDLPFLDVWAASEGQSDYFATQVCARKLWASEVAVNAGFRASLPEGDRQRCNAVWTLETEQDLCYRTLAAVTSMTNTMAAVLNRPAPDFGTPDPSAVTATNTAHPAVQCRMDTALQGALCSAPFNEQLIPGKKVSGGPFSLDAERESAVNSCTAYSKHTIGLRPACWYKANL